MPCQHVKLPGGGHAIVCGPKRRLPKCDCGQPAPLLLALHGGGGHMELQADDAKYGLISKSEQAGFIAVFPNGSSAFIRVSMLTPAWTVTVAGSAATSTARILSRCVRSSVAPPEFCAASP